ncbi:MAG: ATPase, T2SS/T4P/T4SS family [Faecalibacterium sp.]
MDEYYRAVQALPAWLARPLSALPPDIAEQVHEIRLRVGCGVQLTIGGRPCCPAGLPALQKLRLTPLQMEEIFLTLCSGSVHSHETEIAAGYVTLRCGCRAGLAGRFYCPPGQSAVLQELRSVNIRVARSREFPLPQKLRDILQQRFVGMLLMGEPDSGKTTLLRGIARELASRERAVAVIDERREIFPSEETAALPLDILSGVPKGQAVQMALRTLSPQVILLDELGGMDELYALEQGLFSGVEFIATLHAASWEEAARRPQVQYLQKCGALHAAVLLKGRTAPGQLKEVRFS